MDYEGIVQAIKHGKINDVCRAFADNPLMRNAKIGGDNLLHKVVLAFSETSDDQIRDNLVKIAQYLVEQGVNTMHKNLDDKTPLQLAEEKLIAGNLINELSKPTVQLERLPVSPEPRKPGGAKISNNMIHEIEGQPSPWRWLPLVVMALIGGAVALLTNFGVISINATPITALFSSMGVSLGTGALGTALAAAGVVLLPALVAYGLMYALDRWVVPERWRLKTGLLAGRMSSVLGVAVVAALVLASAPVTWPVLLAIGVAVPLAAMLLGWGVRSPMRRIPRQRQLGTVSTQRGHDSPASRSRRQSGLSVADGQSVSSNPDIGGESIADNDPLNLGDPTPVSQNDLRKNDLGEAVTAQRMGLSATDGGARGRDDESGLNEQEDWIQSVTHGEMKDCTAACFEAIRLKQLDDLITMRVVKAFNENGGDLGAVDESKEGNLLFAAVLAGKRKVVSYLVDVVDDCQFHQPHGFAQETPLMAAAQSGDQEMVAFLLPQSDPTLQFNDAGSAWDMVTGDHARDIRAMFIENVRDRLDTASMLSQAYYTKQRDEDVRRWCKSGAFAAIGAKDRMRLLGQASKNKLATMISTMLDNDPDRDDENYRLELFKMAWKDYLGVLDSQLQNHFLVSRRPLSPQEMDRHCGFLIRLFKIALEDLQNQKLAGSLIDRYLSKIAIKGSSIDADWIGKSTKQLGVINQFKLAFLLLDAKLVQQLKQDPVVVIDESILGAVATLAHSRTYDTDDDKEVSDCILWLLKDRDNELKDWEQEKARRSKGRDTGVPSALGMHADGDKRRESPTGRLDSFPNNDSGSDEKTYRS